MLPLDKKELVLDAVKQLTVPNIELIARSSRLSRITAKKYLDELVPTGTIRESRCGNSRIYSMNLDTVLEMKAGLPVQSLQSQNSSGDA